ncbi:MAG TPA: FxLYD domain-containing protein [Nitrososphaeraceae archaeon]
MKQITFILIAFLLALYIFHFSPVQIYGEDIRISSGSPFDDSSGMLNIIGVVTNYGTTSEQVTVGLDIHNKIDGSNSTLHDRTFSKIIFPGKESPFKFRIDKDYDVLGKPYILEIHKSNEPFYNVILQNYSNFPIGQHRELVGTLKNIGQVVLQNISVYASVHDKNGSQIDSIKSNIIPILKPGEVKLFSARPDYTLGKYANYFSCAGIDLNTPINTLDLGNGKFLTYGLESLAKISNFTYDKASDSISFIADHYNPLGGIVTFEIPQLDNTPNVKIYLDNIGLKDEQITKDGKTIITKIFIPPKEHSVRITGILNQS